jgi:hypothetical protein
VVQLVRTGSHGCLWIPMAVLVRTYGILMGGAQLVRTYGQPRASVGPNGGATGTYGQPRAYVGPNGGATGTYGQPRVSVGPDGGAQLVRTGSHGHLWVLTAVPRVSVDPDGGAGTYVWGS